MRFWPNQNSSHHKTVKAADTQAACVLTRVRPSPGPSDRWFSVRQTFQIIAEMETTRQMSPLQNSTVKSYISVNFQLYLPFF